MTSDEHDIQAIVAEGNDEQLPCLAHALQSKRLEELMETSNYDLIVTSDGAYLTKTGEARLRGARSNQGTQN